MIPRVKISVSEDTTNYYTTTVPFVPVVIMHTNSGNIGTRELVRSENDFINKFGKGTEDTPAAYAVQSYLRTFSYLYITRLASSSAAYGTASMGVGTPIVNLVDFKTTHKTAQYNGTEIHLIYDSEAKKLYLSTVINSVAVLSVKETIDFSTAEAPALATALDKICNSFNAMELGITATNRFTDKVASDPVPEISDVRATISQGDSGLGTVSNSDIITAINSYCESGLNIDVMIIPEYPSAEIVNYAAKKAEEFGFMVLASPNSADLSNCITDVQGYEKSNSLAVYFPNVKYSNYNATIPASIAVLNSYARNDSVNKWLAPAGTQRGLLNLVTNVSVKLNDDNLDTLYNNLVPVNPIKFIEGTGYTVWGQKTTATDKLYLDRINIARLVKYVYREVNAISHQYLFEPITERTFTDWGLKVSALLDS